MQDLQRFVDAQDEGDAFRHALAELRAGRKRSHWIWFVFPQLAGLGQSYMARLYGIRDRDEAEAYLRHPVLGPRLAEITRVVAEQLQQGVSLETLMGAPIDALKLISSMTLFALVARSLSDAAHDAIVSDVGELALEVLAIAEAQGHPACRQTSEALRV